MDWTRFSFEYRLRLESEPTIEIDFDAIGRY